MSAQPIRTNNPAVSSNPPRNLPIPKPAPKPPGSLPVDLLVLEQQRQILELQKQVLELQIQQQKGTASVIEAKTPLLKMQMDDITRREASVRLAIEECQRRLQAYKCFPVSHPFPRGHAWGERACLSDEERQIAIQARLDFANLEIFQKEFEEVQSRKKALEIQIQQLLNTST